MSVALSIQPRGVPLTAARYVPVATQDTFKRHWVPGCEALGLKWVPLFETGIPLEVVDLPVVLQELRVLESWTQQHAPESGALIAERLARLISELSALVGSLDGVELFIG